ncbi:MAG: PIN domain-containing protein [Bacteroidales bacterium]|nr:PIN domain-containing protein [Candidatus Physcocola equi]
MRKHLFLDTNIVIDVLANRQEALSAANLLQEAIEGNVVLYMSALTVANITYIMRKDMPKDVLKNKIKQLCKFIKISPLSGYEVVNALNIENPDLEDAIQYFSAMSINADYIITRDASHFRYSSVPVVSASEFMASS